MHGKRKWSENSAGDSSNDDNSLDLRGSNAESSSNTKRNRFAVRMARHMNQGNNT